VNLQHLLDRALGENRGRSGRIGGRIGHSVLEVLSPPYTILPVVSGSRTGEATPAE
jgi:hypothetical protein